MRFPIPDAKIQFLRIKRIFEQQINVWTLDKKFTYRVSGANGNVRAWIVRSFVLEFVELRTTIPFGGCDLGTYSVTSEESSEEHGKAVAFVTSRQRIVKVVSIAHHRVR